jgi:hypothetical protein
MRAPPSADSYCTERIIPMRITSFAILAMLYSGAAFAATHSETTTYVDGNLTGISPNTGGTLAFPDDNTVTLRTGLSTVNIPYTGISHAELGAVKQTSHDAPLYKVWELHKRLGKTETQLLIVNFKNDTGEEKSMTLELAKSSAHTVLTTIQTHNGTLASAGKPANSTDSWWGDSFWKTKANQDKWSKPTATTAPDQQ